MWDFINLLNFWGKFTLLKASLARLEARLILWIKSTWEGLTVTMWQWQFSDYLQPGRITIPIEPYLGAEKYIAVTAFINHVSTHIWHSCDWIDQWWPMSMLLYNNLLFLCCFLLSQLFSTFDKNWSKLMIYQGCAGLLNQSLGGRSAGMVLVS